MALVPALAPAGTGSSLPRLVKGFKAGSHHDPTASIASLTRVELAHARRSENVQGLLMMASRERRLRWDETHQLQAFERFSGLPEGDALLLACLKVSTCEPLAFADIARLSELHREVLMRRPSLNLTQANHAVGDVAERVMSRHFERSGWVRVEGQIGRGGIDGLFVKFRREGGVREVLIVESKYNTSALRATNHGEQMSREWVERKLQSLRERHPDEATYGQIDRLVRSGYYRARLWTMRVNDGNIEIDLHRVRSTSSDVDDLIEDPGTRVPLPPRSIRLAAPHDDLERELVEAYSKALKQQHQTQPGH